MKSMPAARRYSDMSVSGADSLIRTANKAVAEYRDQIRRLAD